MNTTEILQWMIEEYEKRGGGYSQTEALKEAISCLEKRNKLPDREEIRKIIMDWYRRDIKFSVIRALKEKQNHSLVDAIAERIGK